MLYEARFVQESKPEYLDIMEENFVKAYELAPELSEVNLGLGWMYFHRGMLDMSYQGFARAFTLDPGNAELINGLIPMI